MYILLSSLDVSYIQLIMVLSNGAMALLIFHLLYLSISVRRVLKSPTKLVNSSLSLCSLTSFLSAFAMGYIITANLLHM